MLTADIVTGEREEKRFPTSNSRRSDGRISRGTVGIRRGLIVYLRYEKAHNWAICN